MVDDDPHFLDVVSRWLREGGFEFTTVSSATDAFAELERTPVAVVLTDHAMPGMLGLDLIKAVQRRYRATRCVMVTGYGSEAAIHEAVDELGVHVLLKPVNWYDLIALIHHEVEVYAQMPPPTNGNGNGHHD